MENLKKSFLIKGDNIIGALGDKNFSTAPLGTVLSFAGQTAPHGYLLCDGASYKVADYPDLYAVIGNTYGGDTENFNVPDYRETVLVGVGENTTDTIADHDVYELGEFKDDQMQSHTHNVTIPDSINGSWSVNPSGSAYYSSGTKTQTSTLAGAGTTTHGKQKGVTYIIKAFHTNEGTDSGVSDDVVNYVEGEIATKLDKGYIAGIADANDAIGENGVNIFVMSASSANMPLLRTGIIRSYTTIEDKYIRVNQEYSTIDNAPKIGGTYKRYGASDDGGVTFTWSNWNFVGSIDDNTTAALKTWSSSMIASQINNATAIKYDNVINPNATKETGWSLAQGESHFYSRLLQLDGHLGSKSSTFSFLLFVKANYDNPTTVYVTQLAGMDDDRLNIAHTTYFELGVSSSGNLTIKNKSAVTASYRFI